MHDTVFTVLISAGSAIVGGIINSACGPWIKWDLEKRKETRDHRKQLIHETRDYFSSKPDVRQHFEESTLYLTIRPHLSKQLVSQFENKMRNEEIVETLKR